MTVALLTAIIASYSSLAIPGTMLILRPARLPVTLKILLIYSCSCFITDRLEVLLHTAGNAIRILTFIFNILEYTLFTLLFYCFFERPSNKRLVIAGSLIYIITVLIELTKFGLLYYSRFSVGTAVILIISYCLLLFHEWLIDAPLVMIYERPTFWIILGCLIYLSGSFFFFITVGKRWEQNWVLHSICNILKNILFTMSIVLVFPRTASKRTF